MNTQQISHEGASGRAALFDRVAGTLAVFLFACTSFFFIPALQLPVDLSKIYFIGLGLLLLIITWSIARLVDGTILFPRSPIFWALIAVPVAFLISALFSPAPAVSFAGTSFGIGSVIVVTFLTLSFFVSVVYLSIPSRLSLFLKALVGGTGIVAIFQIAYLFLGTTYLHAGTFFSNVSNLVGRWNDLGIFFGAVFLGVVVALEIMPLSKLQRVGMWVLFVVAGFFLILVNFPLLWGIITAFSVILLVYSLAVLRANGEEPKSHFPFAPFIAVLVALLFLIANPIVGRVVPSYFGVSQADVRPSIEATATVTWQALKKSPIVGIGPNRFTNAWLMYRPSEVIATDFWDTNFTSGFGLLPSFIATTGVLGTVAFVSFIVLFLIAGLLHIFRKHERKMVQASTLLSFSIALYGWVLLLLYNPGIVCALMTFVFSGIFIGLLGQGGVFPVKRVSFLEDPRKSFFSILVLVGFLLVALALLFVGVKKFTALTAYAQGSRALLSGDTVKAEQKFSRAVALDSSDLYYRGIVSLRLSQIQTLFGKKDVGSDALKQNFQTLFSSAEAAAQSAVRYDTTNPENWTTLATLYQSVVPLNVDGAYKNAKAAYEEAQKLSPQNPGLDFLKARLEIDSKNTAEGKKLLEQAIATKPNFVEAYALLSKLQKNDGDAATALQTLEKAVSYAPRSALAYRELGLYKYQSADYQGSITALEQSLIFDRTSAITAYFLGLSYEKGGRIDDAKSIFSRLVQNFPQDTILPKILENLNSGKSALDGLTAEPVPVDQESTASETKTQ